MKHRKINRIYRWKNSESVWFKRHWKKITLIAMLSVSVMAASAASGMAAGRGGGFMGGLMGQSSEAVMAENPSEIVTSTLENAALSLTVNLEDAARIQMNDSDSKVRIEEPGVYVISGECADGGITIRKGTAGVVLVLDNLNLSSSTGAVLSINKEAQVKIVVNGTVTLTNSENPADEKTADAETSDAFDGAAIKAKAGTQVVLTGDGTLNIAGRAKNGIKVSGEDSSFVVDGEALTLNINAVNDGINAGADLTLLSGTINIAAADDAIHADRILTIGDRESTKGPSITANGAEGLEATVVNIFGGNVQVSATDDAINATQKDDTLIPSLNVTGGNVTVESRTDGLDCNGNINLLGGTITIASSASFGGEAGIDYDGTIYVAQAVTLNNPYGIAGPDGGGKGGFDQRGGWNRGGPFQQRGHHDGQFQPDQLPQDGQAPQDVPPMQPFGPMNPFGQMPQEGEQFGPNQNLQTDTDSSATAPHDRWDNSTQPSAGENP